MQILILVAVGLQILPSVGTKATGMPVASAASDTAYAAEWLERQTALHEEGAGDGGEDGDGELDDGFPGFEVFQFHRF